MSDVKKLDADIQVLETKKDELNQTISEIAEALPGLREDLQNATDQRGEEHDQNVDTVKKAKEGVVAIQQAIDILTVFYKKASMASSLLQASPVDEDTEGAGFSGSYKGKQSASGGIIG